MLKTEKYLLIKGKFRAEDAREIILNLINDKIRYHDYRNFSSGERLGKPDEYSLKRIEELKQCRKDILEKLLEAQLNNLELKIHSEIRMELVPASKKKKRTMSTNADL